MKTQHTKGEWVIEQHHPSIYVCSGYKGFVIAEVTNQQISHFIGNDEEAQANAKLIAAAPDMLEALNCLLETMRPHIMKMGIRKGFSEHAALAQAQTAIHKATE